MVGAASDHGNGGQAGVSGNHSPFHLGGVPFGPTVRGGTFSQAFQVSKETELSPEADDEKGEPGPKVPDLRNSDGETPGK